MIPADWFAACNPGWWLQWAVEREVSAHPGSTVRMRLGEDTVCGFVPATPCGERRIIEADEVRCTAQYRPLETQSHA
jgi:hypothetical protein